MRLQSLKDTSTTILKDTSASAINFEELNTEHYRASAVSVMKGRNDLPLAIRKVLVLLLI